MNRGTEFHNLDIVTNRRISSQYKYDIYLETTCFEHAPRDLYAIALRGVSTLRIMTDRPFDTPQIGHHRGAAISGQDLK